MSIPLAQRAEVAQALATHLFTSDLRDYIDARASARDADGDPVILTFGADEGMQAVIDATRPYPHPVMLSTIYEGNIFVCVLGTSMAPTAEPAAGVEQLDTDATTSVADLVRMLLPLDDGQEFVLTYQHAREGTLTLAGSQR